MVCPTRWRSSTTQEGRVLQPVIERGIARGDIPPSMTPEIATELLIGRSTSGWFGGALNRDFGKPDALLSGTSGALDPVSGRVRRGPD